MAGFQNSPNASGTKDDTSVTLYAFSTMWKIDRCEFSANSVTSVVKTSTTACITRRNCLSVRWRKYGRRMFSAKVTDGASSVADAQLLMADSSAPKNITCANIGAWVRISCGRISCESVLMYFSTMPGSIIVAE
ncbi:hypothetical protein D3C72_1376850 [compost metagenome]